MQHKTIQIDGITVTSDTNTVNEYYKLSPEIIAFINKVYSKLKSDPKGSIQKLKEAIQKNPEVPHLKNYLSKAYLEADMIVLAKKTAEQIVNEHPNYLFGKISYANFCIDDNEYSKIPQILGEDLQIQKLYNDRTTFNNAEFLGYYYCVLNYYCNILDIESAERTLDLMKKVEKSNPLIKNSEKKIFNTKLLQMQNNIYEQNENIRTPKTFFKLFYEQTTEKPVFENQEIEQLYQFGRRIDPSILKNILNLERNSLISDLEKVIIDSQKRYKYFTDLTDAKGYYNEAELMFPTHAIHLLAELNSTESLNLILNLYRQNDEFLSFWFSDSLDEFIYPIAKLAENQLNIILEFLKEPNIYTYSKSYISESLECISILNPEKKPEIIQIFKSVFEYFLSNSDNEDIIDTDAIGLMLVSLGHLHAVELLDLVKELFDKSLVFDEINGDYEETKKFFYEENKSEKTIINNIFDNYQHVLTTWDYYIKKYDLTPYQEENKTNANDKKEEEKIEKTEKTGRNDPCPCGSGKKYKKCCGK